MSDEDGDRPAFDTKEEAEDYEEYIHSTRTSRTSSSSGGIISSVVNSVKEFNEQAVRNTRILGLATVLVVGKMELESRASSIKLPKVVKSAKGVEGDFSVKGYDYRIDTNKVAPGEGGFHIHIFRDGDEIAKVNGRGGFVANHKGENLLRPSQLNKTVRNELNKLINYVQKNVGGD